MKQPLPEKFGKFEVVREVGKGGFGVVYEGKDPVLKRRVAIKTCNTDDASMRQRFQREAEIVASLQHPNITTVHDLGVEDEVPYLVQEYLSGQDLSYYIIQKKELPIRRRLEILRSVARGLEHAHKRGIVHRDIKPGNVRVLENGTVKVMDFGIAKLTASSETQLTQSGMMIGTAAYLAPEQVSDVEVDHRCDIFSFGVVAYELLTFQRPFAGTTISALLYKINHEEHTPLRANLPSAPAALSSLIDDCLAKDPAGRPISFTKVLERLDEVEAALTGDVQPIAPLGPEDATRLAGGPKPTSGSEAMDLASAATMVTPSGAMDPTADPTAKTMLTRSDGPGNHVAEATRIEPNTAERQVSESAMSQMFSNASKPSMIAVAAFALIAAVAVWFALSRGGDSDTSGDANLAESRSPTATASATPERPNEGDATASGAEPNAETSTGSEPTPSSDPPPSRSTDSVPQQSEGRRSASSSQQAAGGSSAHAAERAADRAPREAAPSPTGTEQPAAQPSSSTRPSAPSSSTPTGSTPPPATATRESSTSSSSPTPQTQRPSTQTSSSPPPASQPAPTEPVQTAAAQGPSAASASQPPSSQRSTPPEPATSRPATSRPATETPAPAPAPVDHRPALQSVMSVYRAAMENQDGGALQRIWPSLTRGQLQRIEASFAATEAMEIEIGDCRFDINVPAATADCRVQRTITPRAGRRQSNTSRSTFSFRQENGRWVLTGV